METIKDYLELESKLSQIKSIERVSPYKCGNFVTPNVFGFVPIKDNISAEITYGTWMDGSYLIGFTIFEKIRGVRELRKNSKFNRCFAQDEIGTIDDYVQKVKILQEGLIVGYGRSIDL